MQNERAYPLSTQSPHHDSAWKFVRRVAIYYLIVYLGLILFVPVYPATLNQAQTIFSYGHYLGLLVFAVFLFFIPNKLSKAKFWPVTSIFFLVALLCFFPGEFILNMIKMKWGLGQAFTNFGLNLGQNVYTFALQIFFFILAFGIRKFANYLVDINKFD